jgi:hypothetical protein
MEELRSEWWHLGARSQFGWGSRPSEGIQEITWPLRFSEIFVRFFRVQFLCEILVQLGSLLLWCWLDILKCTEVKIDVPIVLDPGKVFP